MAFVRTIIYDGPERTDWVDVDAASGTTVYGTTWKPGSEQYNDQQQRDRLQAALATFEANYTGWATLTNVQKDTAARNAQRALAALIRQQLGDLESAGV